MGKAISLMMRPVKKFNIENRAHRVISREKPVPAPLHKSTGKQIATARAANPTFMETHYKKDPELNERLKNIYVQSRDPQVTEIEPDPNRPLPVLTRSGEDFEYGFWEPKEASEGRCTLGTVMDFMAKYQEDPIKYSATEIAKKYKLDLKDVENILEYFRVYKIVIPERHENLQYTDLFQIESSKKKADDTVAENK